MPPTPTKGRMRFSWHRKAQRGIVPVPGNLGGPVRVFCIDTTETVDTIRRTRAVRHIARTRDRWRRDEEQISRIRVSMGTGGVDAAGDVGHVFELCALPSWWQRFAPAWPSQMLAFAFDVASTRPQ
jgi:hypothetical protein